MACLPLTFRLDKGILIIGGGPVAINKYHSLAQITDQITVVAQETSLTGERVFQRAFQESDLDDIALVVLATGNRLEDERIHDICRRRSILVDRVSDGEKGDFFIPSLIKRGDLMVTISTSGKSPAYAKHLREEIEGLIPPNIEDILRVMASVRSNYHKLIPNQVKRATFYRDVLARLLAQEPLSNEDIAQLAKDYYE